MKLFNILAVILFILSSCEPDGEQDNSNLSSFDTLVVNSKAAVFYSPDLHTLNELKQQFGKDGYKLAEEDYKVFINKAREYCRITHLKIINTNDKQVIKFIYRDKEVHIIDVQDLTDPWGVFLFDEFKRPKQVDIGIFEIEYNNYF